MKKENLLFFIIPASQLLMLLGVLTGRHSLDFWGYGGIVPVSYTHLDVYKRQGISISRLFPSWKGALKNVKEKT